MGVYRPSMVRLARIELDAQRTAATGLTLKDPTG